MLARVTLHFAISYGYSYDISHLPSADQLTKNIDFKQYLIGGLVHNVSALHRMEAMYNRIGRLFRIQFLSEECISSDKSHEAAKVISNNSNLDGWNMLLALSKGRFVQLGARPNRSCYSTCVL